MAVTLRLARHGQKKRPYYRIVAADKQARRDGRFLEVVGTYNPMINPAAVTLKEDKVKKWLGCGAKPTQLVRSLIAKSMPGLVEERERHQREKLHQRRLARKQRQKAHSK